MYYRVLLVIICFFALLTQSLAQNPQKTETVEPFEEESIKIDAQLVTVPVIVSDPVGRYITGLEVEDFLIYEDEVEQKIEFFSVEAAPFHVMLLVDTSYSVVNSLAKIKGAALEFVDNLRDEDEVAAIGFSSHIFPLTDGFTRNKNDLSIKLNRLEGLSETALYDAVYTAAHDVLKKITGRKAVILLTDGFDNRSRFSAEKAIKEMVESGALVYVVRYPSGNLESQKLDFINELVEATAGFRYDTTKIADLSPSLQKIAAELRHVYTVGYYPSNPLETGGQRRIQLKVKEKQDIIVRYKKAYDSNEYALAKSNPPYIYNFDKKILYKKRPSFSLENKKDISSGLGVLSATIDAKPYHNKRIRLSSYVRTENVAVWAAMWMRIDDKAGKPLTSCLKDKPRDTLMDNLLTTGTAEWTKQEIVLDVGEESQTISYGIFLDGMGKIWISSPIIEVVDKTTPTTETNNWQKYKIGQIFTKAEFQAEKR